MDPENIPVKGLIRQGKYTMFYATFYDHEGFTFLHSTDLKQRLLPQGNLYLPCQIRI